MPRLKLEWAKNYLTIVGEHLPGGDVMIHYLEAYCRAGSTNRAWGETVIRHRAERVSHAEDGSRIELRDTLDDGLVVTHTITAKDDEVDFRLTAHNPTATASAAHWAQPCIQVDQFTGHDQDMYLQFCFVFVNGQRVSLPTEPWAETAFYTPGQVYCPAHVPRTDVNPRPLSEIVPSNGLCGAFSVDSELILATAWEPYQELFQGVRVCMHSDFRLGGVAPGETKHIRGKIYLVSNDVPALVKRYEADFPEHVAAKK